MKEIENYMSPAEAAYKWGIKRDTLKNRYSPSMLNEEQKKELQRMIDEGLIKFFLPPNGTRKDWIISRTAMFKWFGNPKVENE
ncbi:DNA-binding protein [Bacillus bombysepticus]